MVPKLVEIADKDRKAGLEVETPLLGKEEGEYVFRVALPSIIRGKLIGTKGANIKSLREETGAKIFVENDIFEGHQYTRIIGPPDVITRALQTINDLVQEEADSDDYARWASLQWFQPTSSPSGSNARDHDSRRESHASERDSGHSWDREKRSGTHDPSHGPLHQHNGQGSPVDSLHSLVGEFPDGALQMEHAVCCNLPNKSVGALIGTKGEYVRFVERSTGTKIIFKEVEREVDDQHRTMMVVGPLMWVYVAHCMIMKKYHEKEQERGAGRHRGQSDSQESKRIDELQMQLVELQNQLSEVMGESGGVGKGRGRR